MCVWCSLDPRITTGSSCFFKYVATQLRMEKMPERAPVWTGPQSPPLSLSLSGTQLALHMSSGWRLTGFAGHSKKLQRGCIGGFLKAVVIVPKQLGPAHRSFHLESWADPFRAPRMNHLLPALPGRAGTHRTELESSKTGDDTWRVVSLYRLWWEAVSQAPASSHLLEELPALSLSPA